MPTQKLKEFKMSGILFDPRCYAYFTLKFPELESFDYTAHHYWFKKAQFQTLQLALYDMIIHFSLLKRLSIKSRQVGISFDKFWPEYEFIQWLNDHPNLLTHLDYPECLYPITSHHVNKSNKNDFIHLNIPTIDHYHNNEIFSNGSFLNHLASLSLRSKIFIETATNFLLLNKNTLVISQSIKELKIYEVVSIDYNYTYLFDWLAMFPNLDAFKSEYQNIKGDNEDDDENEDDDNNDKNDNTEYNNDNVNAKIENKYDLHYLIKQRKQQLGINDGLYKLKTLEIKNGTIRIKNGFTSFFTNFCRLNRLILNDIKYSYLEKHEYNQFPSMAQVTQVNMSHLYLDYVSIGGIWIVPWNPISIDQPDSWGLYGIGIRDKKVKKIIISESSSSSYKEYIDHADLGLDNTNNQFSLHLFCKYVDQFVFINDYY